MLKVISFAGILGILFFLAGCTTNTPPSREADAANAADAAVADMQGTGKSSGSSPQQQDRTIQGGKEPSWVTDPYSVYGKDRFVAASSSGSDRNQAEKNALAALIAIFGQSIQADLKMVSNYSEAVSKGVVQVSENTSIQNAIKTSSEMDSLIGAEIRDVWSNNKNNYYAVAVLERTMAATLYTDIIKSNQRIITDLTALSDTDKYTIDGYARYQLAATIADVNRVYANVLTVVGNTSDIVPGNLKKGDDYRLEALNITKNIPIGVRVNNDRSDRIKGAFAAALGKQGFRSGGTNSRYVLDVTVVLSEVQLPNQSNKFARYEVDAKLTDTRGGMVLFPFNINGREGHLNLPEAENRAVAAMEKKINETYSQKLSEYLSKLLPNIK